MFAAHVSTAHALTLKECSAAGRGQSNTRKKPNYQQGLDLLDRGRKMGKLAEIASKRFQAFLSFLGRSKGRARLPGRSAAPSRFGGGRRAPHPDIWRLLGDRRRPPGGFLAGTVKKKLGFSLASLKPNDGVRRYRIETRRAR
jgi:hypothetical protein